MWLSLRRNHLFELTNFGVNLTHLEPGGISALLHSHEKQDEFVYMLEQIYGLDVTSNDKMRHQLYFKNSGWCFNSIGDAFKYRIHLWHCEVVQ